MTKPKGSLNNAALCRLRGHPEQAGPAAMRLGDLHRHHRGREVGPRGHPVPDPVEIVLQVLLERLDGLPVHPRCTLVPFHLDPGVPDLLLADLERLARCFQLVHAAPPPALLADSTNNSHGRPGSFAPPPLQGLHHYYGPVRQRATATVLMSLRGTPGSGTPSHRTLMRQFPGTPSHVPHESRRQGSCHLCAGHRLANRRAPARLLPEHTPSPRF